MQHTKHTRETILTLYGDYVLPRGGELGIGSLITLLGNFGQSELAIRSAVSRMCSSGLLKARRDARKSYYSLTREGSRLLTEGAQRIFERKNPQWDGSWSIVTYSIPERLRKARDTLRVELGWMGYGAMSEATWISPFDLSKEVRSLLKRLDIEEYARFFTARHCDGTDPVKIISRCWDLSKIHRKYVDFIAKYEPKLEAHRQRLLAGEIIDPRECFVTRFNLINEYRRLPFFDPDLPLELLPKNWLRSRAAALFDGYHGMLTEKASDYFDCVCNDYQESVRD